VRVFAVLVVVSVPRIRAWVGVSVVSVVVYIDKVDE
jgi:hypothetical protein